MMWHKIILAGYLGKDPEMRYTPNGMPITTFSVATSGRWTDAQGQVHERTTWWRVITNGKLAENCNEWLLKGRPVLIEGTLISDDKTGGPRVYERRDGTAGASFELRAHNVRFLGRIGGEEADNRKTGEPAAERELPAVPRGEPATEEETPW